MGKFWQSCLTYFIMSTVIKNCQSCTPFTPTNEITEESEIAKYISEAVKDVVPVFNSSTVPNLDSLSNQCNAASNHEDFYLNITEILNKYGYPTETHQVNSDGYLLDIFRIPGNGTPVLVFHGLFSSSDDWVSTGTDRGLAYSLADQGYDVWLGNTRGNVHGRKHTTLSPNCSEFWDYSWHEIGIYDVPAIIDYILETTGHEKLAYVGHSQGCTSFFVMASELPEYNDKISVMVAMSPVSYLKYCTNPFFTTLAPIADPVYLLAKTIGVYEILTRSPIIDLLTSAIFGTKLTSSVLCYSSLLFMVDVDITQFNATLLPPFLGHFPGGSAIKQYIHYLQLINSGKFGKFDLGAVRNCEEYGLSSPPDYPLHKIKSKIVIFYADGDRLFNTPDRIHLLKELPNVVETYRIPLVQFKHGDYLAANDLKTLVNDKVLEVLKKYA